MCLENPFDSSLRNEVAPVVKDVRVLEGIGVMRNLVAPSGAAAEQVALVLPPPTERT